MVAERNQVIEPELVMPDQFFSSLAKQPGINGERRLMLAVLEDAVSCYQRFALSRDARARTEFAEAAHWIDSREREWPYSYENICDVLGLNPAYIRDGLRRRGPSKAARAAVKHERPFIMPLAPSAAEADSDDKADSDQAAA